ncbi:MAG: energy transducer TonB [Coprobacillus sp.]|nr:energy transducer TonB [Coprobacillus sp.]
MKSNTATNEIGVVALDAQYSEFGEYTQRMLEAIQAAWYVTCQRSEVHARGVVGVRFSLGSDGTIRSVEILQASAPEIAVYACQDAIESRAPYEEWGPEMIERFGDEQSTTIWFHYR